MRPLAGLLSAVVGTVGVVGLLLAMGSEAARPPASPERAPASFEVAHAPRPPKAPRPRAEPRPQRTPDAAPPLPVLAAGLGGLDLGFGGPRAVEIETRSSVDAGDPVMTADAVDVLPEPLQQAAPAYPPAARAKGLTGSVTLSLQIDATGRVTDVELVTAQPTGVFDEAALRAARTWRFRPATYGGRAVAVRVEQTLNFDLER